MDEKDFALRLAQLRQKKNVSAREMSLAIGQNPNYINHIETGSATPSLSGLSSVSFSRAAATLSGVTFSVSDVQVPERKDDILKEADSKEDATFRNQTHLMLLKNDIISF